MVPRSIHNNRFISPIIYKYIIENENLFSKSTTSIGKHNITILGGSINVDIDRAKKIFEEVSKHSKGTTNDRIDTYIYLVDVPKILDLDKDNITSAECNSASTTFYIAEEYVEVAIWRSEEWEKVLYHELIHAFFIDYTVKVNKDSQLALKQLLPHYNNSIREAYTEILATLMYTNSTSSNIKDQCIFLGTQVNKIAFFIEYPTGFDIDTVENIDDREGIECIQRFFKTPNNILDDSTNTSSYYILKSIYLWCGVYKDSDLLDIGNMLNAKYINKQFYSVILEALENGEYIKWLQSIYFKPTNSSLRLTTVH